MLLGGGQRLHTTFFFIWESSLGKVCVCRWVMCKSVPGRHNLSGHGLGLAASWVWVWEWEWMWVWAAVTEAEVKLIGHFHHEEKSEGGGGGEK